ncbi:MAG: bifunctional nicotinamidase/pyrazinamidase [Myxococcota bacterium]
MVERALILVDLQNDFMPGGALEVANGGQIVPVANAIISKFDLVVATQDWHPLDHGSFVTQNASKKVGDVIELGGIEQVVWPVHCVQGSDGAAFHASLDRSGITDVFQKGTSRRVDSYSGFFDNDHEKSTGLGDYLKGRAVRRIYIMGLATDYCVKFTALDAVELGFETSVVEDGCVGVELNAGDVEAAFTEMRRAGVRCVRSADVE